MCSSLILMLQMCPTMRWHLQKSFIPDVTLSIWEGAQLPGPSRLVRMSAPSIIGLLEA